MVLHVSQEDIDRIRDWLREGAGEEGDDTRYPHMTFEQGAEYMLDILECRVTIDELLVG